MADTVVLAVIPARGGSKGVPRKNIRVLAGRPLIAWTIQAALDARTVQRVVVSTDDAEIAEVARSCGAEVPMLRPAALAQDDTPGVAPPVHVVEWLADHEGFRPNHVLLLQPTSPLRTAHDIDAAVDVLHARQAASVVSVCETPHHPAWLKRIGAGGELVDLLSSADAVRPRQALEPAYVLNGAIYLVTREVLLERRSFYADITYPYLMPVERSLDIDSLWDFQLADLLLTGQVQGQRG